MIKRLDDGRWLVDIEPKKNKRIRKRFDTKAEALRFERHVRAQSSSDKNWLDNATDRRSLSQIFRDWYALHGHSLRDGQRRADVLKTISYALGDPVAAKLTGNVFSSYRAKRVAEGIKPKTLNNHLGYLKAAFNELRAIGHIGYENPLAGVRPLRVQERELSWLTADQISILLKNIRARCDNPHVEIITLVCLATGCRWSEAENLTLDKVKNSSVVFTGTKNGKVRTVPISEEIEAKLVAHLSEWGVMSSSITSFRRALSRSGLKLPEGQASHALRHTFASHFIMNGGNILVLQRILGHSSINMTMRYAHLAPGHFREAVDLNPLNLVNQIES